MIEYNAQGIKRILRDIFNNHEISYNYQIDSFSLNDLTPIEFDKYLHASIGYFECIPSDYMDLYAVLHKLQIFLKTNDVVDQNILGESFKQYVFDCLKQKMEWLLEEELEDYKQEKENERFSESGYTQRIDEQTGEKIWQK